MVGDQRSCIPNWSPHKRAQSAEEEARVSYKEYQTAPEEVTHAAHTSALENAIANQDDLHH